MSRPAADRPRAHYELIAIGSGPAGRQAATVAAGLGKRAAVIERAPLLGGSSTNGRALPLQALRAAAIEAVGGVAGVRRRVARDAGPIAMGDLMWRARPAIALERDGILDRLRRAHVDVLMGDASFVDPHTIEVRSAAGSARVTADRIVVAVGTRPVRPIGADPGGETVVDPDSFMGLSAIPRTMTIVGAGAAGLELASITAVLGAHVTVVDRRSRVLPVVDAEVAEAVLYHLKGVGVAFRLGEEAQSVVLPPGGGAVTHLAGGASIPSDAVLWTAGREGATRDLNLSVAGVRPGHRGRIAVDARYRTEQAHILAAGDVAASSSPPATPAEQGRLAALAAFGAQPTAPPAPSPRAVHTIPAVASVGRDERSLTCAAIPFVRGIGAYRDLVQSEIQGDRTGFLKLLVHAQTRRLLGVHILGTSAAELVHVGQTAMLADLPVDDLARAELDPSTFAHAYGVAARDAVRLLADDRAEPAAAAA